MPACESVSARWAGKLRHPKHFRQRHDNSCVGASPSGVLVSRVRVLLADDHRMLAEGLKSLLAVEFDLVGVVEDGRAMVEAAKTLKPDVIVADITMPSPEWHRGLRGDQEV